MHRYHKVVGSGVAVTYRKAQQSMIKLETLQSVIPILKFYYIDIIVGFMLFFGGLGIGIGLGTRIKEI